MALRYMAHSVRHHLGFRIQISHLEYGTYAPTGPFLLCQIWPELEKKINGVSAISAQIFLFSGKFRELEAPFPTDPMQEIVTGSDRMNSQTISALRLTHANAWWGQYGPNSIAAIYVKKEMSGRKARRSLSS